jgi:hypothetical protein
MQRAILSDAFTFVINGEEFQLAIVEAIALSPAIETQLLVDSRARRFVIDDPRISANDLSSLRSLLSGSAVNFEPSSLTSRVLLSRLLCNMELEHLIVSSCSFSDLTSLSRDDLSQLSIEALDDLFSSRSLQIENEDALLSLVLDLGSSFSPLLRHIQFRFLTSDWLYQFYDYVNCCDFSECLWYQFSAHLPFLGFEMARVDSVIVSDFPPLFDEFCHKKWSLLWRGSRDGFGVRDFHSRCDGHANTLTLIVTAASEEDVGGFVFGGFTPVPWDSKSGWKSDDRRGSLR